MACTSARFLSVSSVRLVERLRAMSLKASANPPISSRLAIVKRVSSSPRATARAPSVRVLIGRLTRRAARATNGRDPINDNSAMRRKEPRISANRASTES